MTCDVSGTILDPAGTPISGLAVSFNVQTPSLIAEPVFADTITDSSGAFTLSILQGLSGVFSISSPTANVGKSVLYSFSANIPNSSSASFSSVVTNG